MANGSKIARKRLSSREPFLARRQDYFHIFRRLNLHKGRGTYGTSNKREHIGFLVFFPRYVIDANLLKLKEAN